MRIGHFYFMEMNTRIQVEHTITEEVYGCDLVKEQIRIAAGRAALAAHRRAPNRGRTRSSAASTPKIRAKNFQPSPGRIAFYYAPGGRGVRIDSHAYTGYIVPPYYDSMIAKIITVGATRASAIDRMRRALDEYYITGIKTTVPFHAAIMRSARISRWQIRYRFCRANDVLGQFRLLSSHAPRARSSCHE